MRLKILRHVTFFGDDVNFDEVLWYWSCLAPVTRALTIQSAASRLGMPITALQMEITRHLVSAAKPSTGLRPRGLVGQVMRAPVESIFSSTEVYLSIVTARATKSGARKV